ncbi:hypothetical protein PG997_008754 [Apiospora hydei]|uniref:CFEM domain-containing protein n=1 Tax=Apiospora hydei TaxID=1337664 RepID=A0ABR1WBQ4_9PEZI
MVRITMKILRGIFALIFLIQFVQAQQQIPLCASQCLEAHLKESKCTATDFDCICADQQLQTNVGTCTLGNCTLVEGLAAMNVTKTICKEPVRDNSMTTPIVTAVSATLAVIFVAIRLLNDHLRGSLNVADLCAVLALWTWISEFTYVPAIGLTKICLLLFFLRVFPARRFRHACHGTIAFVIAFSIATFTVTIFSCAPVRYFYLGWAGDTAGTCIDINAFWFSQATVNIVTDLWIMALPIPQIFKLDLERKKKIFFVSEDTVADTGHIGSQSSVSFASRVLSRILAPRTQHVGHRDIFFTNQPPYFLSSTILRLMETDTTVSTDNNVGAATWSVLECNVGIVCCCMPYVRSLLNRVFPNCFGGTFFSSGGGGKKGQKYHTMTSTTAATATSSGAGGDGTSKLQQQTTNATATTTEDGAGGDDGRKCGSRIFNGAENPSGPRAARSGTVDTIEMAPMNGSLAKYPEW